jgi:hypothetical protein
MSMSNNVKWIFVILVVFCLGLNGYILIEAQADDTGLHSPSLSVLGGSFGNPDNAFTSNDVYATSTATTQSQQYANFGFSIPAGSTINGIEALVEGKNSKLTGTRKFDIILSGDNGSAFTTSKTTENLSTTDAVYTLGTSIDLWGGTWDQSKFSDANFRVKITSTFNQSPRTMHLDHLQVKVYYTLPPPTTTTTTTSTTTTTTTTSTTTTTVPTIVTLLHFTAEADDDGKVTLTWKTASEINNAGFNICRARRKSGNYIQINNTTIDPRGDETSGASYSFMDTPPGPGTYYYKLEDIDYSSAKTMHGPVKVRVGYSAAHRR